MKLRPIVIAIDGPAASGKGTLARRLAERFGFAHLDTGALYRATALLVLNEKGDPADPITAETAARRVDDVTGGLLTDPVESHGPVTRLGTAARAGQSGHAPTARFAAPAFCTQPTGQTR